MYIDYNIIKYTQLWSMYFSSCYKIVNCFHNYKNKTYVVKFFRILRSFYNFSIAFFNKSATNCFNSGGSTISASTLYIKNQRAKYCRYVVVSNVSSTLSFIVFSDTKPYEFRSQLK